MEKQCCSHLIIYPLSTMYTFLLGAIFIALSSSHILLVKYAANEENKYDYLPTTVNVCSELVELVFCVILKAMAVVVSNFSIITTALLFRIALKRHLNWIQWASFLILFLSILALTAETKSLQHNLAGHGFHHDAFFSPSNSCLLFRSECPRKDNCVTKERTFPEVFSHIHLSMGHVLIIVQCFISSMANICNEKILKKGNQLTESIFIQNSKLCFFGILFNGLTLGLQRSNRDQIKNLALIFVTAFQGLSMVFILKFLDMFHVLRAQVTTVIITTVSVLVFDFRLSLEFFLKAPSVLVSIFIYNANKPQGPEYAPRQERIRDLSGNLWESSSGDGEELERLTKPKSDESDEDTF
uniref:Solute carrier family 35 member A5 n=1 Tax=Colobus angolensis palliatus TaxID=336983 RepID=A0A2K5IBY6_COLAP